MIFNFIMSNHSEHIQSCKNYIADKYSRTTPYNLDWEPSEIYETIIMQEPNNQKRAADLPCFVVAGVMRQFQADAQLQLT